MKIGPRRGSERECAARCVRALHNGNVNTNLKFISDSTTQSRTHANIPMATLGFPQRRFAHEREAGVNFERANADSTVFESWTRVKISCQTVPPSSPS